MARDFEPRREGPRDDLFAAKGAISDKESFVC